MPVRLFYKILYHIMVQKEIANEILQSPFSFLIDTDMIQWTK